MVQAVVKPFKHRREDGGQQRRNHCGEQRPHDKRVPLPGPEQAGCGDGMMARRVEKRVSLDRHSAGVEDQVAGADEDQEERDLQRIDDVIGDLRGDQVEPQEERKRKAGDCGGTEQGIDPHHKAKGERPGQLARAAADAQQMDDRRDEPALKD